jgi:hypothetical protein
MVVARWPASLSSVALGFGRRRRGGLSAAPGTSGSRDELDELDQTRPPTATIPTLSSTWPPVASHECSTSSSTASRSASLAPLCVHARIWRCRSRPIPSADARYACLTGTAVTQITGLGFMYLVHKERMDIATEVRAGSCSQDLLAAGAPS